MIFVGLLFAGCVGGGQPQTPSGVVKAFVGEINQGNFKRAANYMVESEAQKIMNANQTQMQKLKKMMQSMDISVVEINKKNVQGDSASVTVKIKMSGTMMGKDFSQTQSSTFQLIKEKGKWRIKQGMQNMGGMS